MTTRPNLTREDWINEAQRALVKGGIDAVRIDTLAKDLGITRGSFYYHFKSRGELLEGILSTWRARATEAVIAQLRMAKPSPEQQLLHLLELPQHGKTAKEAQAIELSIRAWARREIRAREAIDEVDNHRLSYIVGLLVQMGIDEVEADDRAYLLYAYQVSLSLIGTEMTADERESKNKRAMQLLAQCS